jgi:hypothetical protein
LDVADQRLQGTLFDVERMLNKRLKRALKAQDKAEVRAIRKMLHQTLVRSEKEKIKTKFP